MKEHGWRRAGLVLALAGMILGCGGNSFAEDQRDPEAANIVASLQRDLKLNYAQVREITPAYFGRHGPPVKRPARRSGFKAGELFHTGSVLPVENVKSFRYIGPGQQEDRSGKGRFFT